jgi:predicted amino acid racemase
MAHIELNRKSLKRNFDYLDTRFQKYGKDWGVVAKLLCGNGKYLEELITLNPNEIHDSRLSNLERVKQLDPHIQRVYIKPPPLNALKRLIACANVSFNTHIQTIEMINEEAEKQDVIHKIIIMIELGDLREGVMGENLIEFYDKVFRLKNIEVVGLGTNLNCLNGILPSKDKLIQLSLYKELINAKFNSNIKWVSGGSSITLPLLAKKQVPKGCNHFRIGETLFFGMDISSNKPLKSMRQDVFRLKANIIELKEKPMFATGIQGTNLLGEKPEMDTSLLGEESNRALIDIGVLDVSTNDIEPLDNDLVVMGGSSDMIAVDLKDNLKGYKLGDTLTFDLNYTGVLSLMNSKYVDKIVI